MCNINSSPASVCPLDLEIFQEFNFSSLGQMYIEREPVISITNFDDLLVNIPHEKDTVVMVCPSGKAARCSDVEM